MILGKSRWRRSQERLEEPGQVRRPVHHREDLGFLPSEKGNPWNIWSKAVT